MNLIYTLVNFGFKNLHFTNYFEITPLVVWIGNLDTKKVRKRQIRIYLNKEIAHTLQNSTHILDVLSFQKLMFQYTIQMFH